MDIDPDEVAQVPTEPAEILARCLGRRKSKEFPRQRVFAYAAASTSPVCQKLMAAIKVIKPADLKVLSFEAMCVRAHVSSVEMLGAILMSAKSMSATESALKAIIAHPDVVQATVDAATEWVPILVAGVPIRDEDGKILRSSHGDVAAQKIIHESVGFLPTKKGGMEINIGLGRPPEDRDEGGDADEAWDDTFPDLGGRISGWSADKHKLLEGGK